VQTCPKFQEGTSMTNNFSGCFNHLNSKQALFLAFQMAQQIAVSTKACIGGLV